MESKGLEVVMDSSVIMVDRDVLLEVVRMVMSRELEERELKLVVLRQVFDYEVIEGLVEEVGRGG